MWRVGLTGGIASGKSRVLQRLAGHGFHTIDLDQVSRQLTGRGSPALAAIADTFGTEVLDREGGLDRAALATRVFGEASALARLNAIVHPRVRAAEERWAAAFAQQEDAVLVTDAALLVESGVHLRFDRLLVAHCSAEQQLARLRARDGLDLASARARIAAQMPADEKRAFAHQLVDTSLGLDDTDRRSDAVAEAIAAEARSAGRQVALPRRALLGALASGPRSGPRGLSPAALLAAVAERGGLELGAVARLLKPAVAVPWYRAAAEAPPGAAAALLAGAVVVLALGRGARDADYVVAAAASVARLTHEPGQERADACLMALVLHDVVTSREPERAARSASELAAGRFAQAERWGGTAPSARLRPVWEALERHPRDPDEAGRACAAAGGEASLAALVAGAVRGGEPSAVPLPDGVLRRLGLRD